jgi:hypothetical protein
MSRALSPNPEARVSSPATMMPSDATGTGALGRGAINAAMRAAARRRGAAGSLRHIRCNKEIGAAI